MFFIAKTGERRKREILTQRHTELFSPLDLINKVSNLVLHESDTVKPPNSELLQLITLPYIIT